MGHKLSALLSDLVSDDSLQHKDVTPDLGMVLMLSTVFQGHGGPSHRLPSRPMRTRTLFGR